MGCCSPRRKNPVKLKFYNDINGSGESVSLREIITGGEVQKELDWLLTSPGSSSLNAWTAGHRGLNKTSGAARSVFYNG